MRYLIFCGTRDALERFDAQTKRPTGALPTIGVADVEICGVFYGNIQRAKIVEWFKETEGATLAVDRSLIHGWRAPADTFILFDPSWPFGPGTPEWKQATARRLHPLEMPYGGNPGPISDDPYADVAEAIKNPVRNVEPGPLSRAAEWLYGPNWGDRSG